MRAFVSGVVVCAIGSIANASLLINGTLDDPGVHESDVATGWTLVETAGANSATFASFADHTSAGPGGVGLWFRSFAGSFDGDAPQFVDALLYQDVAGTPGVQYSATAWFKFEANYPGESIGDETQTTFGMSFLDAGMGVVGNVTLFIDGVLPRDSVWRQFQVGAIAPAGTAFVRVFAEMNDGHIVDLNPQSAFVDDFELVPAPGALGMFAVGAGVVARRKRG